MTDYIVALAIRQAGLGDKPPHDVDFNGNICDGRGSHLSDIDATVRAPWSLRLKRWRERKT